MSTSNIQNMCESTSYKTVTNVYGLDSALATINSVTSLTLPEGVSDELSRSQVRMKEEGCAMGQLPIHVKFPGSYRNGIN